MSETLRLSDDDRYALATRADAGTRANRPSHLVAIGGLALLLCLIIAAFAWRADAGAAKALNHESSILEDIRVRADRLAELKADLAAAPTDDRYRPIPDILSRISNLATEAGMTSAIPVPATGSNPYQESRRLTYQYRNLRVESLEPVVAWINLTTQRIPGLHPTGIKLTPQANAWQVDIMFARYERLN